MPELGNVADGHWWDEQFGRPIGFGSICIRSACRLRVSYLLLTRVYVLQHPMHSMKGIIGQHFYVRKWYISGGPSYSLMVEELGRNMIALSLEQLGKPM